MAAKWLAGFLPTLSYLRNAKTLWLLFVTLVLVFVLFAVAFLYSRYQARFDVAEERLNNLVVIYEDNFSLQMRNIERFIQLTATEYKDVGAGDDLQLFVTSVAEDTPQLRTLLVIDATGNVIADSRPDLPAIDLNVSDRRYFMVQQMAANPTLFIDDPVQSRVDGDWSLPISLGVWSGGDFMGVIVASLDSIFFSSSIDNFVEQDIEGYILKDNRIILTSLPYDVEQIGQ